MKKPFYETRLGQTVSAIVDTLWAGILWLVCSLPVLTAGAASCALYYAITKSVRRERGHLTQEFFHAFRENFKYGTLIWLTYLVVIIPAALMPKIAVFYIIPVSFSIIWIFPLVSRFSESYGAYWKNTLLLCIGNLPASFGAALGLVILVIIAYLVPFLIILLPGLYTLLLSYLTEPVFKKITAENTEDDNNDKWYNE